MRRLGPAERATLLARVRFAPLLVLYLGVVFLAAKPELRGDEARYVMFAQNLAQGFYSPRGALNLWSGPGYPLVLAPLAWAGAPWILARVLNAVWLFGAVILFAGALRWYVPERRSAILGYVFGLYPPFLRHLHMLFTETLAVLLVCGFAYCFCRAHQPGSSPGRWFILSGLLAGYLALTKIMFGYVLLAGVLVFLVAGMVRRSAAAKRTAVVLALGLAVCLPYLGYTYRLTGKVFYWGNSGGESLYWASSPYPEDLGDWHAFEQVRREPQLYAHHAAFIEAVSRLDPMAQDEALTQRALANIAAHPLKYLTNTAANAGRLLFAFPYTRVPQEPRTFFYLLPNMVLVVVGLGCLCAGIRGRRHLPYEVVALQAFAGLAFSASLLVSAYERQFRPLVPIVMLGIAVVLARVVRIEVRV